MQLKILYTAALILCMSILASSHECSWPCQQHCKGKGKVQRTPAGVTGSAQTASEKGDEVEFSLLRILFV
ncbi:MAG: hypothetical protein Q8927_02955 [Bacteroidota bacterium]|nr:hypothetical protein [Bacteroidota bacterium]MDP4215132.1 hypothetical protein [Bacteroidota bacterium]MDP4247667.1 hypothetical protein [Bacteroidota bacterium]MDP4254326.1 hypothetical protein [Bacteroidota bacterium]MDP4258796.1 hypothetical protein [Bacteroidota bacterium]